MDKREATLDCLRAFLITETELKLMASAAIIADSNWPVTGDHGDARALDQRAAAKCPSCDHRRAGTTCVANDELKKPV